MSQALITRKRLAELDQEIQCLLERFPQEIVCERAHTKRLPTTQDSYEAASWKIMVRAEPKSNG